MEALASLTRTKDVNREVLAVVYFVARARGPGTSDYMLRTLRSLVKFTWLLISNNISGTFQM